MRTETRDGGVVEAVRLAAAAPPDVALLDLAMPGMDGWVAAHADRLRLFILPPYCPELNSTEYLNNSIKGTVPRVRRAKNK